MAAITSNESITKSFLVSVIYPTPALFKIGTCCVIQAGPKLMLVLSPPSPVLRLWAKADDSYAKQCPSEFLHLIIRCLPIYLHSWECV